LDIIDKNIDKNKKRALEDKEKIKHTPLNQKKAQEITACRAFSFI
jgi:hypothetical protein